MHVYIYKYVFYAKIYNIYTSVCVCVCVCVCLCLCTCEVGFGNCVLNCGAFLQRKCNVEHYSLSGI